MAASAAASAAAEKLRECMSLRDNEANGNHCAKYGRTEDASIISDSLYFTTIENKEVYGLDFNEFKASMNKQYSYVRDLDGFFPKTPLEEVFWHLSPIHCALSLDSVTISNVAYNTALKSIEGMTIEMWHKEVTPKLKEIAENAKKKRRDMAVSIRNTSVCPFYIRLMMRILIFQNWMGSMLCKDSTLCCEDFLHILKYLVFFPFRCIIYIILTPFSFLAVIIGSFIGTVVDILTCYSSRVNDAMKLTAIESVIDSHQASDNKAINTYIKSELEQLANHLSKLLSKTNVKVVVCMVGKFNEGVYHFKFIPAHTSVCWQLHFCSRNAGTKV